MTKTVNAVLVSGVGGIESMSSVVLNNKEELLKFESFTHAAVCLASSQVHDMHHLAMPFRRNNVFVQLIFGKNHYNC